jgi:Polyketide cyclase / dehydrase and lipid transport
MSQVSHHFVVARPLQAVFDVVTTVGLWPQWHPATRGVEGDIDHPARLGDRVTEHVTIAGIEGSGTWTVTEYDPPRHLALEAYLAFGYLRISYWLAAAAGGGTRFQRDLDFPDLGARIAAAMESQSAQGVANLARLVEREIPAGTNAADQPSGRA